MKDISNFISSTFLINSENDTGYWLDKEILQIFTQNAINDFNSSLFDVGRNFLGYK